MAVSAPDQTLPVIAPLEDRLRVRLDDLKANRERFMAEAQRNLAALDAAIGELSALIDPPAPIDSPSPNGHEGDHGQGS